MAPNNVSTPYPYPYPYPFLLPCSLANTPRLVAPFKYDSLPLGSIKPLGWLKDQLRLSAEGLAGHEWDFYRYAMNSTWSGGTWEYSGLHETAPYWFNYIVPLAWSLDDARLKAQAKEFLDSVLDAQQADGWLGPETAKSERGLWARALLLYGMIVSCLDLSFVGSMVANSG